MTSRRLRALLRYFPPYRRLYDIGTDHALLPIAAWEAGLIDDCLGVDNKPGPLEQARQNLTQYPKAPITPVLADGLEALDASRDLIVFAGVGGQTIHEVIAKGPLHDVKRMVFQPTMHAHRVRALTDYINWHIVDETVVEEADRHYPIIVMEPGKTRLTLHEKRFGPVLLKNREPAFLAMLTREKAHLEALIEKLPKHVDATEFTEELAAIKEVLDNDPR